MQSYAESLMKDLYESYPIPYGSMEIPPQPFLEMDGTKWSVEAFEIITHQYTRPVIVRNLFADIPAASWTEKRLAEHFKDRQFVVMGDNTLGGMRGGKSMLSTVPEVVKNVTAGGNQYMFNSNFLWPQDQELLEELGLDRLEPGIKPVLAQFFLGIARPGEKRIGGSPLHAAAPPNLNIQIKGSKQWTMIEPNMISYLNPYMLQTQFAALAQVHFGQEGRWTNYPRLQGIVNPGDAIYIPPWYFHEVANIPGPDWQISCALRFPRPLASYKNHAGLTLLTDLGVRGRHGLPGTRMFLMPFMYYKTQSEQQISKAGQEYSNFKLSMVSEKDRAKEMRDIE